MSPFLYIFTCSEFSPISCLLHKARYPGLLEFGGFFFLLPKTTKHPSTHFCPFVCLFVDFVCRTSSNQSAKRRMGWDGLCDYFLRSTHFPATYPTVFLLCRTTPARFHAGACGTGLTYNRLSWPIHSRVSG